MFNEKENTSQFQLFFKPHFEIEKQNRLNDEHIKEFIPPIIKPCSKLIATQKVTFYGICRIANSKGML